MELTWLEDYLVLAETLNFSRAAEARHVTQPAFSRRIRALEDWVGTPLVARTTHNVSLTPAGQHFQSRAESLTRALHQSVRETVEIAAPEATPLAFATTTGLASRFFPAWIHKNQKIQELATINLVSGTLSACEQMLLRGDVQFLLCYYHPHMRALFEPGQFRCVVAGIDTLVPLSAPDETGAPRWSLRSNAPVRHLAYNTNSGFHRILTESRITEGRSFTLETAFTALLSATLLPLALAGDGVAWLPRSMAEQDIEAGRLVEAGGPELSIPIEVHLFRPAAHQSRTAEAVWSYLQQS